jgi:hypothetical protein
MYSAEDVRQVIAFMLDKITAAKGTLQKSLDRAWEDEDLNTTAVIAANAIAWRNHQIDQLREENIFMRERLQWLLQQPKGMEYTGNNLTCWQWLVVREALGLPYENNPGKTFCIVWSTAVQHPGLLSVRSRKLRS